MLDHTIDGIMTVSTTGHPLSVNKAMCHIFGYARLTWWADTWGN